MLVIGDVTIGHHVRFVCAVLSGFETDVYTMACCKLLQDRWSCDLCMFLHALHALGDFVGLSGCCNMQAQASITFHSILQWVCCVSVM